MGILYHDMLFVLSGCARCMNTGLHVRGFRACLRRLAVC